MRDPRFDMEIRGRQLDLEAKLRNQHDGKTRGPSRRGSSVESILLKMAVLIAIVVGYFWFISN